MKILIVDDDKWLRLLIEKHLVDAGYKDIHSEESGAKALEYLKIDQRITEPVVDLVLLDLMMPAISGIEVCKKIKELDTYQNVPIIMITSGDKEEYLEAAFEAQAMDFINKPIVKVELIARIKSALNLRKKIVDKEKRERKLMNITDELYDLNQSLIELASFDELTQVYNRRSFDEFLDQELRRAKRFSTPISLILIDVDNFKLYNDHYGHVQGDFCLQQIAKTLKSNIERGGDILARYGGEEFAVVLPATDAPGAEIFAEKLRKSIEEQKIPHKLSQNNYATISLGIATVIPTADLDCKAVVEKADQALYKAKSSGRNQYYQL